MADADARVSVRRVMPPDTRNRELAQIHIAKAQLGMADDTYRALLWTLGRVRSAAALDYAGRQRVLDHMRACGFKARPPKPERPKDPAWAWVNNAAPDRQAMLRKIAVMLQAAGREKSYVDGIARQMFRAERIEFCAPDQLHRIVAALEVDRRRREARKAASA
jgi:phage gp16-like protein